MRFFIKTCALLSLIIFSIGAIAATVGQAKNTEDNILLRFAVLGDAEPKPEPKFPNLAAAVADVNQFAENNRLDFVIGVGDIAHKGTLVQYENATPILQQLNKPFYPIMGNEEHGSTETRFLQFANLWNKGKAEITATKYVLEFDSVALIFASPDHGRDFNDQGIAWLNAQVKRLQPKPVLLIVHGAQQGVFPENMEKGITHPGFTTLVAEPNVAAVISGDLHMDMDRVNHSKKIGHVHYLHIPALERTKIPDESNHTAMYRMFSLSAAGEMKVDTYQVATAEPLARHAYHFSLPVPASSTALHVPLPLEKNHQSTYLTVGNSEKIHWRDASGASLAYLNQSAELLDWRYPMSLQLQGETVSALVAATVFLPEQQPGLIAIDVATGELRELLRVPTPAFKIESLCLSRAAGDHLSLYLLDERGTAEHWLVVDAGGKPGAQLLRRLPIAPNSKACAVDDVQDLLFITEEGVGIWAQGASEESAPGRVAVDMQKPFGRLPGSVESIAVIPQGLIAAIAEEKQLALYSTHRSEFIQQKLIPLPATDEPEVVKAVYVANTQLLQLVVNDEKTGNHKLQLPWRVAPQPAAAYPIARVTADVQTESMLRFGDAADDPAIWVNKKRPQKSLVIGTNKQQGLFVYDLQGREVQLFNTGKLNNVDVRYGVRVGKKIVDVAVATNRDDNSLAIYTINPRTGKLSFSGSVATDLEEIYGFCMYQSPPTAAQPEGVLYAIPNAKSGEFQQIQLNAVVDSAHKNAVQWQGQVKRRFYVDSQPEGCVADDKNQRLFVGEEDVALWTIAAEPDAGTHLEKVLGAGDILVADIEGVGLYEGKSQSYVVISSQGNNSFVVLNATAPYDLRGIVRIVLDANNNIDGVSETDGLEVTNANLGALFPEGMLVVQDGHKVMPEAPQNFKYVSWEKIRRALSLEAE
jgi:3-phytase